MKEYKELVQTVLEKGLPKENRTGVKTLSYFGYFYRVDLREGYPLLTTKKMYFASMLHELFWYLSGEEHIRNLRDKTKIWDAWADDEGRLETAYGRFWRRFPVPRKGLDGERWGKRWVSPDPETGEPVFDQIRYLIDSLREIRRNPSAPALRRLVLTAWHPGNAAESLLPPCHYTFCLHVSGEFLNGHLTQRSGDVALGIPFNLACYALLLTLLAQEAGFRPGIFAHSIIDAHIYENHTEGLKEQLRRPVLPLPRLEIADKPLEELRFEDIRLSDYRSHPALSFKVSV